MIKATKNLKTKTPKKYLPLYLKVTHRNYKDCHWNVIMKDIEKELKRQELIQFNRKAEHPSYRMCRRNNAISVIATMYKISDSTVHRHYNIYLTLGSPTNYVYVDKRCHTVNKTVSPNLKLTVDMDKLLVDFVLEKLKQNKLCSMNDIRKQAMYIHQNCNIKQKLGNFKASLVWCKRWMKRHHLSYLRVSNRKTGQKKKKPENSEETRA